MRTGRAFLRTHARTQGIPDTETVDTLLISRRNGPMKIKLILGLAKLAHQVPNWPISGQSTLSSSKTRALRTVPSRQPGKIFNRFKMVPWWWLRVRLPWPVVHYRLEHFQFSLIEFFRLVPFQFWFFFYSQTFFLFFGSKIIFKRVKWIQSREKNELDLAQCRETDADWSRAWSLRHRLDFFQLLEDFRGIRSTRDVTHRVLQPFFNHQSLNNNRRTI